tara:strand:- start:11 stop:412 length:402 start_codon:yes stop_codon:yes gene_type:complete
MAVRNQIQGDQVHGDRRMEPEQTLWIAVLSQAIRDCFTHVSRNCIQPYERDQAREFLLKDTRHFRLVCELAGRDPSYVRGKIRKHVLREQGWNVDKSITDMRKNYRQSEGGLNSKYKIGLGPWMLSDDSTAKE